MVFAPWEGQTFRVWRPGSPQIGEVGTSSGGHYDGNAETYMNVGEAMGRAMVELLQDR